MSSYVAVAGLQVDSELKDFIEKEALPGTGVDADRLWEGLAGLLGDLAPRNRELLQIRDDMQARVDAWCTAHKGGAVDGAAYEAFLREIG